MNNTNTSAGLSHDEICALYRDAKDKEAEIGILAELNDCDVSDIIEILNDNLYDVPGALSASLKSGLWRPDEDEVLLQMARRGTSFKAIAETLGRKTKSVRYRYGVLMKSPSPEAVPEKAREEVNPAPKAAPYISDEHSVFDLMCDAKEVLETSLKANGIKGKLFSVALDEEVGLLTIEYETELGRMGFTLRRGLAV